MEGFEERVRQESRVSFVERPLRRVACGKARALTGDLAFTFARSNPLPLPSASFGARGAMGKGFVVLSKRLEALWTRDHNLEEDFGVSATRFVSNW